MIDLSIIIVNWNTEEYLKNCLESIYITLKGISFETFVVDNNSTDLSVPMVHNYFPKVQMIENDRNLGFGQANNIALKKSSGKYLLLLNPDTIIKNNTVQKMITKMKSDERIGAIGPKILNENGSVQKEGARNFPTLFSEFIRLSRINRLKNHFLILRDHEIKNLYNKTREVEALSGSCMLLNRQCIFDIKGFDEKFFLYGEDIDLCFQIKKKEWKIIYYPKSEIIHMAHKSTEKVINYSPHAISCYSMFLYFLKNKNYFIAYVYRLVVIITSAFWIGFSLLSLRFISKKPLNNRSYFHDCMKLCWALTNKITLPNQ